jgi:protein TonB
MPASRIANAPRQAAILATIVGLHAGALMLVMAGLHPRLGGLKPLPQMYVYPLPTPPKPPPEAPRLPGPADYGLPLVPEPTLPIPRFDEAVPPPADDHTAGESRVGSDPGVPTPELRAPMLRTRDSRLAALIDTCYPSASRRLAEEGRVVAEVHIDATGHVGAWNIVERSGFSRLDAAVTCVVRRLEFVPARRDGAAVAASVRLPIAFRLD